MSTTMNNNLPILSNEGGLSAYLEQIKKFPMLDAEEEYMLAKNWKTTGNIKSAEKLVTSHLRLVAKIAMGYKGNNVVGDKKYKKRYKKLKNINKDIENVIINLNRNFLHAKSLGFKHPISNKELIFSSNLPDELENIIKKLRNSTK